MNKAKYKLYCFFCYVLLLISLTSIIGELSNEKDIWNIVFVCSTSSLIYCFFLARIERRIIRDEKEFFEAQEKAEANLKNV